MKFKVIKTYEAIIDANNRDEAISKFKKEDVLSESEKVEIIEQPLDLPKEICIEDIPSE